MNKATLITIASVIAGIVVVFITPAMFLYYASTDPTPPVQPEALDQGSSLFSIWTALLLAFALAVLFGVEFLIKKSEISHATPIRIGSYVFAGFLALAGILPNLPAISPAVKFVKDLAPWGEFTPVDWAMTITVIITLLGAVVYAVMERGPTLRRIGKVALALVFFTGLAGFVSRFLLNDSLNEEIRREVNGELQGLTFSALHWFIGLDTEVKMATLGVSALLLATYILWPEKRVATASATGAGAATPTPATTTPARSGSGLGGLMKLVVIAAIVGGIAYVASSDFRSFVDEKFEWMLAESGQTHRLTFKADEVGRSKTVDMALADKILVKKPYGGAYAACWSMDDPSYDFRDRFDFSFLVFKQSGSRTTWTISDGAYEVLKEEGYERVLVTYTLVDGWCP